ncbi:hypothetical protein JIY74_32965 [Vibrio harveyi]|nr:hypothetical protein [Vibrio harveyi]
MQSMFYGTHEFNQDINTKIVEKQNGEKYTA